jgi:hypothetical protein
MRERPIRNAQELQKAANDLLALGGYLPIVLTVTEGSKLRSTAQNARYWANIEFFMAEINTAIDQIAETTGYSNLEARRVVAEKMDIEHAVILFARTKEVVHEVLKQICRIPTSTKLGTKAFNKFSDRMDQVMADILGEVRAIR